MNKTNISVNNALIQISNPPKKNRPAEITSSGITPTRTQLIRFEWKRQCFTWVQPDDIVFVISADHYVRSLIRCGKQNKWMCRHCTIKELLSLLSPANFIRLNKFYLLNCNHFSRINKNEKILYLDNDFSVPVPHRISRYVLELLKK